MAISPKGNANNRQRLGISSKTVGFGTEHSLSIYNAFVSRIIFNLPELPEQREANACLRMLSRVAFLNVIMTANDALVITKEPSWDPVQLASSLGKFTLLFTVTDLLTPHVAGGIFSLYSGFSVLSLFEMGYWMYKFLMKLLCMLRDHTE